MVCIVSSLILHVLVTFLHLYCIYLVTLQVIEIDPESEAVFPGITSMANELRVGIFDAHQCFIQRVGCPETGLGFPTHNSDFPPQAFVDSTLYFLSRETLNSHLMISC